MRNLDEILEKQELSEKRHEERKEDIKKKIKEKKEKLRKRIKKQDEDKHKNLMPPMFEMLIVVINRGRGDAVLNYLKSIQVNVNIVSFGEGTAPSNIAGVLGFSQEKEVLFTVVNLEDSERILDLLDSIFLSTEKYAGIAFTIPLKSMTNNSIEQFKTINILNNKGGKR